MGWFDEYKCHIKIYWFCDKYAKEKRLPRIYFSCVALKDRYDTFWGMRNVNLVYCLVNDKEVVYVGSTKNIFARIQHHMDKEFTDIYFIINDTRKEAYKMEAEAIRYFSPKYNKNCNLNKAA